MSPPFQNLSEIYVQYSVDVTPTNKRSITAWIQYSKDNGVTWEDDAILEWTAPVGDKNGEIETYNASRPDEQLFPFQLMASASQSAPIRLRIVAAWPHALTTPPGEFDVFRIQVFYWKITATAVGTNPVPIVYKSFFIIRDNTITGVNGKITVYNVLGQKLETANSITLSKGIYIVQSEEGLTQKICIK